MMERQKEHEAEVKKQEQLKADKEAKKEKQRAENEKFWDMLAKAEDPNDHLTAFSDYL